MNAQVEAEKKRKQQEAASNTTVGSVVGEVADAAADIVIIDSLVNLAGDIISGILD